MKVNLKDVRLAFPQLFEAKTVNGEGKAAFSASFLLPHDHPSIKDLNAAIDAVAKEKWGVKAPEVLRGLRAQDKVCLHDGNAKSEYDGYADNLFVSARSATRPLVIDRDKSPLVEKDGRPYAGCYVYASIELWAQDNQFGKRINASLKGVQFYRDGDAFAGGAPASPNDFEDLGAPAEEAALT